MKQESAGPVTVAGRELACLICGHTLFTRRKAQLNTRLMSFLNFDFLNPSGTCLICDNCGYIHWFAD